LSHGTIGFRTLISERGIEAHNRLAAEEIASFGVPDSALGEVLCAWVQPRAGTRASEQETQEFCRNQIAHYKVPRYVRFVDAFPMTVTGKVQKFIMRERMIRELLHEFRRAAQSPRFETRREINSVN
jgi:fatty-acyl-CoA synthase